MRLIDFIIIVALLLVARELFFSNKSNRMKIVRSMIIAVVLLLVLMFYLMPSKSFENIVDIHENDFECSYSLNMIDWVDKTNISPEKYSEYFNLSTSFEARSTINLFLNKSKIRGDSDIYMMVTTPNDSVLLIITKSGYVVIDDVYYKLKKHDLYYLMYEIVINDI